MIYLMALIPVKIKWMAWISGFFLVLGFLGNGWDYRLALLAAFANYFIFFGQEISRTPCIVAMCTAAARVSRPPAARTRKRCITAPRCGRTEIQAPDLEFRVARDGQEYCVEHLPKPTPPAA